MRSKHLENIQRTLISIMLSLYKVHNSTGINISITSKKEYIFKKILGKHFSVSLEPVGYAIKAG